MKKNTRVPESIVAFFAPSELDTQHLTLARETLSALADINSLIDYIEFSDEPEGAVRILVEILLQKDEAWMQNESGNDIRAVFFYFYFDSKTNNSHPAIKTVLALLQSSRTDPAFLSDVVATLPEISKQFKSINADIHSSVLTMQREHKLMKRTAGRARRSSNTSKKNKDAKE